ncbi:MAG: hypothetical protein N2578_05235, partial [Bdellovibrionaceae bacterium]|nr:hypothetical protein [Pseudobdellovibrionaceae bacterium]
SYRDALRWIADNHPTFVMIPLSHTDGDPTKLARLLRQTFHLCTIMYEETNTLESFSRVKDSNEAYRLLPPISGPAIERVVNRYLRNLQLRLIQAGVRSSVIRLSSDASSEGIFSFHNGAADDKESLGIKTIYPSIKTKPELLEGVEKAFRLTFNGEGPVKSSVQETCFTSCFRIQSPGLSGYLLLASGERNLDPEIKGSLLKNFQFSMKRLGAEPDRIDFFEFSHPPVNFIAWAYRDAAFIRRAVHSGVEVAMAFFHGEISFSGPRKNQEGKMRPIRLEELDSQQVLEFDLYLRLELNNRFIKLVREGDTLESHRKNRLALKGIGELFFCEEDREKVDRYRAENYLRQRIAEFNSSSR